MGAIDYVAPASIEEAVAILSENKDKGIRTQPLAGGTDVLVQLKTVDRAPCTLLDVKRIPELMAIDYRAGGLRLGAAVPCAVITEREDLTRDYPGLVEAIDLIGSTQIQGRASPGGNLCNASPAGDTIPAMIVAGATCVIRGADGERRCPVEAFVTGVGSNCLAPDELLIRLEFPQYPARCADAYLRFIPRTEMDIAVAGAGVRVTLDEGGTCRDARVAIGAVAPTALLVPEAAAALVGSDLDEAALAGAADAVSAAAAPITDKRGTVEYRRKVVGVLTKRAAAIAGQRARER